jgi:uncharacterized RDD family membrane protein YckC
MFELYILLLTACLIVYIRRRKVLPPHFLYLALSLFLALSVELFQHYYTLSGKHSKVHALYHGYQLIEFAMISMVYYESFRQMRFKTMVKYILPVYLLAAEIGSVFIEGIKCPNIFSFLLGSFLLVIYSGCYILELFFNPETENLLRIPFFWINTGIMFYCAGSFLEMGLRLYVQTVNPGVAEELQWISHLLNCFLYLVILIGFLCRSQKLSPS